MNFIFQPKKHLTKKLKKLKKIILRKENKMIDYIKLHSELGINIERIVLLIILLIFILVIVVEYFFRYYDEEQKGFIYIAGIVGIILFSIGISYYIDKKREPVLKAKALKYNVKNIDNLGKNIEVLEKEFEFYADKENKINEVLNEFYKSSGKTTDEEIIKKLKN